MYPQYWTPSIGGIFMKYSYEYKKKCVELYRQGKWPETPEGVNEKAGSSEISKESNSESAVQDTEASETQTTEKTQQTWGSIGGYYTVKRGDTLAGISKKMYQSYNYIEMIAEANGIDNVDEIYPGQILEIPQIED